MIRKGEWLELIVPRSLTDDAQAHTDYLTREFRMPAAYVKRMHSGGDIIRSGDRLRLRLFDARPLGFEPQWQELEILFEDDFCLVVNKPAGIPVHPSAAGAGGTLANGVAFHYQASGERVAVRHIHRLDDWTTGPVLYAKNAYAQHMLDEDMRHKRILRSYVAIAHGRPTYEQGVIDAPIGRDRHVAGRRRVSQSGLAAVTHYEVMERFQAAALFHLQLETGRTHQIRVHLSHLGHPIIGDRLYGGDASLIARQALHGMRLSFHHPLGGELIEIEADMPDDMRALLDKLSE